MPKLSVEFRFKVTKNYDSKKMKTLKKDRTVNLVKKETEVSFIIILLINLFEDHGCFITVTKNTVTPVLFSLCNKKKQFISY